MAFNLPSLNAMRAFEAAARHGSIKHAAEELYVTSGAVSQQIKALEEALGRPLFVRSHRAIETTEAGEALSLTLRDAFQRMTDTIERMFPGDESGPLTVSVSPSFAAKWLVPRLGRFRQRHPEIDVRVSATGRLVDFYREDVDLAVRHGRGRYPGLRSEWLLSGVIFPVCSPKLMTGEFALGRQENLRYQTLLHSEPPDDWEQWLAVYPVDNVDYRRGPRFSDDGLMLEAAIDGQGVAVSRAALVADDLAKGLLVRPFDLTLAHDWDYYLVCPEATADRPKIVAFRDWMREEAQRSRAPVTSGTEA